LANISMCKAVNNCIQKDICYRFNAIPEPIDQVYMRFHNLCFLENDWYWFYGDRSKMVHVELIEEKEEDDINE